jgi:hypothetical protein
MCIPCPCKSISAHWYWLSVQNVSQTQIQAGHVLQSTLTPHLTSYMWRAGWTGSVQQQQPRSLWQEPSSSMDQQQGR